MKKSISACAAVILVLTVLLSGCGAARQADTTDPKLVEDESWFSNFSIADGSVYLYCHLVIENPAKEALNAVVLGQFHQDKGRLLEEGLLPARHREDMDDMCFTLSPGTNAIDVVFLGTHADADVKQNQLLPGIFIIADTPEDAVEISSAFLQSAWDTYRTNIRFLVENADFLSDEKAETIAEACFGYNVGGKLKSSVIEAAAKYERLNDSSHTHAYIEIMLASGERLYFYSGSYGVFDEIWLNSIGENENLLFAVIDD